jgi:mono/diheme cytochrome c family protein
VSCWIDPDGIQEDTVKRLVAVSAVIYCATLALTLRAEPPAQTLAQQGRQIFRFDTFGDEQLWTSHLQLHQTVASVTPATALDVGLKVDVQALPPAIVKALIAGDVDLDDPAVTRLLLSINAVVGVMGQVDQNGNLVSIGITCALCHSTVDNSLTAGIGRRLDGWPNRDLDVGAIIALSPVLTATQKQPFLDWEPGFFDPRLQAFNGTGFISLNATSEPVVIPPAYGLRRVGFETFTGDGPISYWNNYVGVTQMGGHGNFTDPRLPVPLNIIQPPPDLVTPKLPALLAYQLSLNAPGPPKGSYDRAAAIRGERVFSGAGKCSTCHVPPTFTDVLLGPDPSVPLLHDPLETGMDGEYASRSITKRYRTSPLRGIWQHPPYFHDGSAADLLAVVEHYNSVRKLGLTARQKADLVEYLKSL